MAVLAERRVDGMIVATRRTREWVHEHLEQCTWPAFLDALWEHVRGGGRIARVEERRGEWAELWADHYDMIVEIQGLRVYVETRFPDWEPDPSILIVSVHES